MKILVIPDRLEVRGGLETHVVSLAKEWNKKSKNNELMIYSNAINREFQNELKGCNLISGWSKEHDNYIIKRFKPDIIVAHPFSGIDVGYRIIKKLKNSKLFVTMHGNYKAGLKVEYLDKITKVICVSNTAYDAVKEIVPKNKLEIIYNGINTKDFYPTQASQILLKKLKHNKRYKTLVAITRLDDGKEIPVKQLLEILPALANKINGLNCVIVGGGNHLEEIKKISNRFKNEHDLILNVVGEVNNIRTYINLADLVLGCDRVALESLLCKKNVFYMGLPKWKGLIKNDNFKELIFTTNGYFDCTNIELINHLNWMLSYKEEINIHTDKLFDEINRLCSLNNVSNRYLELFIDKKKELN